MTEKPTRDLYREVTDRIIAVIEAGAGNWQMPWHCAGMRRPVNAKTGRPYSGVNVVSLWSAAQAKGYGSCYWASYKQWGSLGAHVRKGEKASLVVFYKTYEVQESDKETGEVETRTYFFARASWVFNAAQVEGFEEPKPAVREPAEALAHAEAFARNTGADIRHGGDRAYYRPATDHIQMPDRERFTGTATSTATEAYYATLLHELTHWTAHERRLDRTLAGRFGDAAYAMEELVAELGAAFLCADLGVTNAPRPDHAAYIANWLEVLKRDKKAIFTAASKASQAAEYLARLQETQESTAAAADRPLTSAAREAQ